MFSAPEPVLRPSVSPANTVLQPIQTNLRLSASNAVSALQTDQMIRGPENTLQVYKSIDNFEIPWSKCPDTLMSCLNRGDRPSERDLRQLITHTVSDMFVFTRRASRDQLRSVARKIIRRSPQSFADVINGQVVSDGVDSIMLMLESKKENMNRRESSTRSQPTDENSVSSANCSVSGKKVNNKSTSHHGMVASSGRCRCHQEKQVKLRR
jgi:hypothetical protein